MLRRVLSAVALLVVTGLPTWAGPPVAPVDAAVMSAKIDAALMARWQTAGVRPGPVVDDGAYLRRASIDVVGRTPSVSELLRFLKDASPDKRRKAVDALLDSPGYVNHMTSRTRVLLMPETQTNINLSYLAAGVDPWLRKHFTDNTPYDQIVRELLTVSMNVNRDSRLLDFFEFGYGQQASPLGFYLAKELKPENLAASTARLFLGVRLECAQCHNHPFAKWTREQFWGMAAFFGGLRAQGSDGFYQPMRELMDRRELTIPGTERVVQAMFLDGTEPVWKYKVGPRTTLAEWMTSPNNPYFAKAAVNRMWAHFFGHGLVEPIDDLSDDNKASHPELFDELARQFVANKYDLKWLIRAITGSKAYQLTSEMESTGDDPRLFARMAVKGMTGEQIFDSLSVATGYRDGTPIMQRIYVGNGPRSEFVMKFNQQGKSTEYQTSIPQALAMMNQNLIADMTSVERGKTLAAVVDAPFLDTAGKIETLYLSALARKPRSEEMKQLLEYVEAGKPKRDEKRALQNIFWALLNSSEFILNH